MEGSIRFNRPINRDNDYISPGGYEFRFGDKFVQFDFEDYEGYIDKKDPSVLHFMQKNPDIETFPEMGSLTVEDLENVTGIEEFTVYTGEPGESDIKPVAVKSLCFVLPYQKYRTIGIKPSILRKIEF